MKNVNYTAVSAFTIKKWFYFQTFLKFLLKKHKVPWGFAVLQTEIPGNSDDPISTDCIISCNITVSLIVIYEQETVWLAVYFNEHASEYWLV